MKLFQKISVGEREASDVPRNRAPSLRSGDHRQGFLQHQQPSYCGGGQHPSRRHNSTG